MNKLIKLMASALCVIALASCSSNNNDPQQEPESKSIDITAKNINSWTNYMRQVSALLQTDADNLHKAWTESYNGGAAFASQFKQHNGGEYTSARNCIEEIVDKCAEIANEVGQAKIGDPYSLYASGNTEEALYAVESWYSWHSRDDYTNNIWSIRNAYFGSTDGTVADSSLSKLIEARDPKLNTEVVNAINAAARAIQAIQQPFRNNINTENSRKAMTACAELEEILNLQLKPAATEATEAELQPIVENYVDNVVVPTYALLARRNAQLHNAVQALCSSPDNSSFEKACSAWITAREPWEMSEAFLFGPVDAMGLDPNMDSWPLDQDAIVQILNSGKFDNLDWSDGDDDDAIEAKQGVRGFHTLEFLLFKDGKPRTVSF